MHTLTRIADVRALVGQWRAAGERIALVPTMGNLHGGHASLLEAARAHGSRLVATVFVNPLQFVQGEDLAGYPRTPEEDRDLLAAAHCDLLFAPTVEEMYPAAGVQATTVSVRGLSEMLCGQFRPGHFDGVATVVTKLFSIVQPDVAVFGEKDYQQLMVIRHMTRDLNLPVEIVGAPTVRAPDGLALSSRNRYLSDAERGRATAMYRALLEAAQQLRAGERDRARLERAGAVKLADVGMRVDYFAIRDRDTLALPDAYASADTLVVLAAARLGRARLIDNLRVLDAPPAPT